jgi:hypothetical protein
MVYWKRRINGSEESVLEEDGSELQDGDYNIVQVIVAINVHRVISGRAALDGGLQDRVTEVQHFIELGKLNLKQRRIG